MPIYAVIDPEGHSIPVEDLVDEQDRCAVANGVWFVRSDHVTGRDVAKALGIDATKTGIVVSTNNFAGFAHSAIADKISEWESRRAERSSS